MTRRGRYQAIVIGASAGGTAALTPILSCLPAGLPLPVVVVQHLHPQQESAVLLYQPNASALRLKEADDKEALAAGVVYFAPPNYHLLIEDNHTFALAIDEKVNFTRPSIDVLFESAADVFGRQLIGVILSGANHDGAAGLRTVKRRGGLAIVQDPATAEVAYMPNEAIAATKVDFILSPGEIGKQLIELAHAHARPGGQDAS